MAVAVVSEFNPFHNGHKYLLETAKNKTGEGIIAVMSGSFTQRGEVAVTDKFSRARTALENGADLVIELPTVYAVSNAQRFAKCGVEISKAFDCVNFLAFGCENDNIELLQKACNALDNENVKTIPWAFAGFPSEEFKTTFGDALLQYVQGNTTFDKLKETVKNKWQSERK